MRRKRVNLASPDFELDPDTIKGAIMFFRQRGRNDIADNIERKALQTGLVLDWDLDDGDE